MCRYLKPHFMHTCFFCFFFPSSSFFFPLLQHLPNTDGGWCFDDGGNFALGCNYANVKAPALGCDTGQGTSSKPRWRLDLSLLLCGGKAADPEIHTWEWREGKKTKKTSHCRNFRFCSFHASTPLPLPPVDHCTSRRSCRKEGDALQGCAEKENNLPSLYSSLPTLVPTSLTPLPLDFLFLFFPLRVKKEERKKKPLHFSRSIQFFF